jgi:hypothetical protein
VDDDTFRGASGATRLSKPEIDSVVDQPDAALSAVHHFVAIQDGGGDTTAYFLLIRISSLRAHSGECQRAKQTRVIAQRGFCNNEIIQIMWVKYMFPQAILEWPE